ncbi:hypothetical protein A2V82_14265 [candidate division KSB1 bacterium RBG_16_48_16]|nr:MAG: hypothetical protein A2V82_14265 [candidate division KSB1 bacterium RBG_16_48_16]
MPNLKHQISNKSKIRMTNDQNSGVVWIFVFCSLEFIWNLKLWDLVLCLISLTKQLQDLCPFKSNLPGSQKLPGRLNTKTAGCLLLFLLPIEIAD